MPATIITVRQPCHEDWQAMTPTARGRHCAACQQDVVDFTQKTDAEILAHFQQASGRTCGRFAVTQLERPLQRTMPPATAPRWQAWLAAVVSLWALREVGAPAAAAQQWPTQQLPGGQPMPQAAPAALDLDTIRGRVVDASGTGIPGATVLLEHTAVGTSTDADGNFVLSIPDSLRLAQTNLVISSVGYLSQHLPISAGTAHPICLREDTKGMGEVVIVAGGARAYGRYSPRSIWWRVRSWFGR